MVKKVMIVDDDIGVIYTIKHGIGKDGTEYEVTTVNNGKECLELLENNQIPDIILLDIMMPGMNGWEIHKKIKQNSAWKDIPIIFLTARTDKIAKDAGSFLGEDYIEKPFNIPELKVRIEKILNKLQKE